MGGGDVGLALGGETGKIPLGGMSFGFEPVTTHHPRHDEELTDSLFFHLVNGLISLNYKPNGRLEGSLHPYKLLKLSYNQTHANGCKVLFHLYRMTMGVCCRLAGHT